MRERTVKSEAEWKRTLTKEQFYVTRQQGTEPAYSGRYCDFNGAGIYHCACCGYELFSSREKFTMPGKWPTFWAPITEERVTASPHVVHFIARTAVQCGRCDAHLGFRFPERTSPARARYVINSVALTFHDDRFQERGEVAGASRPVMARHDRVTLCCSSL